MSKVDRVVDRLLEQEGLKFKLFLHQEDPKRTVAKTIESAFISGVLKVTDDLVTDVITIEILDPRCTEKLLLSSLESIKLATRISFGVKKVEV